MKYFFIVGCPRSGTTWLQMLLAQHPAVATTQETHLFSAYLGTLQDAWDTHRPNHRRIGLQTALTEQEFSNLCTDFAKRVMEHIAAATPGATVVVEKTPSHVRYVPLILKLFPDAHFIHLVRDPRAAVASLCAAGRTWGESWASADPIENARMWVSDVSAGGRIRLLTGQNATVRYEELLAQEGWRVLQDVFALMGLQADNEFCQKTLADCAIERLRDKNENLKSREIISGDPAIFYRRGNATAWADDLSPRDVEAIEYIASDLMREYGYVATTEFAARRHKPRRLKQRELLNSLEWRANRMVTGAFRKARRLL